MGAAGWTGQIVGNRGGIVTSANGPKATVWQQCGGKSRVLSPVSTKLWDLHLTESGCSQNRYFCLFSSQVLLGNMSNVIFRKSGCMILLVLIAAFPLSAQGETAVTEKLYWFWSTDCNAVELGMQISISEVANYNWSVPLCHGTWKERVLAGDKIRIEKKLDVTRSIVWSGYRDEVQVSPAGDTIEVNIWLAGAEPDGVIIGVSFVSESLNSILMNTIFHASHDVESSIEVAPGLIVRSRPTGNQYGVDPWESWVLPEGKQP